ncbi:MAG: hypothetical protein HY098_00145 [Nitrospinae bacterium]|nr:hypothetical protein [Nitrospinota bacterium]
MLALSAALYLGQRNEPIWSPRTIILVAVFVRLLFLFRAPQLSDDVYRYLWDGAATLSGHNPYSVSPAASARIADAAPPLKLVNHPDLITIYPPAAQVVFAAGSFMGGWPGMKLLLVAMDVGVCLIMVKLLSLQKLPPTNAVVYAWHPLPVLEIAFSGHVDAAAVFFMMLAVFLLAAWRNDGAALFMKNRISAPLAGFFFSFAFMVKLFPLVLFPAYLRLAGAKGRPLFAAAAVAGVVALSFPFLPDLSNMFATLKVYLSNWEFAGFAFGIVRGLTSSGRVARLALAAVFLAVVAISYRALFSDKTNFTTGRPPASPFQPALKSMYVVTLAFLLLTPTLHPWYALYLAFILPFCPGAAGLVLTWGVLLSYRVLVPFALVGKWAETDDIPGLVWGAAVAAMIVSALAKRRSFRGY